MYAKAAKTARRSCPCALRRKKSLGFVYHALSAQPGMLVDLTLCTIENQHENKRKKHVGVEHGPHQCSLADRATAGQGCQSMQTAVANKLLAFP